MEARDKKAKVFLVVPSECAWNTGEIDPKKPNLNGKCTSKPSMFIRLMQFYGVNMGKNMFKLESYKPISRSRHSSLHLWLHMVTKQPPRVCAVGKWSNVTTDMARNGSMCSFHLHLVQPTAPSLLGSTSRSTSRNGFSMLQLPHFRILYLQFPPFQQPEPKMNKYQQYVENNHGFPQNDLHSCWGFP